MKDFLEQFVPRVYAFALRLARDVHLAEDLTQEALLRAWDRRGQLRDPERAAVWVFRIVANTWRDQCRRAATRNGKPADLPPDAPCRGASPARCAELEEDVRLALEALDSLPPRQREVLHLAACEGLSLAEIAEVLSITPEAAKASLSVARKQMRERLRGKL